jgi:hypothetical protein
MGVGHHKGSKALCETAQVRVYQLEIALIGQHSGQRHSSFGCLDVDVDVATELPVVQAAEVEYPETPRGPLSGPVKVQRDRKQDVCV